MKNDFTVQTQKSFDEAVASISAATERAGFRVLYIHDVQDTLAKKGFTIEPLKIIEICNAKNAYGAIQKNIELALMLPCKINVYQKDRKIYISALRPTVITKLYPDTGLNDLIDEVDEKIVNVVNEAK